MDDINLIVVTQIAKIFKLEYQDSQILYTI